MRRGEFPKGGRALHPPLVAAMRKAPTTVTNVVGSSRELQASFGAPGHGTSLGSPPILPPRFERHCKEVHEPPHAQTEQYDRNHEKADADYWRHVALMRQRRKPARHWPSQGNEAGDRGQHADRDDASTASDVTPLHTRPSLYPRRQEACGGDAAPRGRVRSLRVGRRSPPVGIPPLLEPWVEGFVACGRAE